MKRKYIVETNGYDKITVYSKKGKIVGRFICEIELGDTVPLGTENSKKNFKIVTMVTFNKFFIKSNKEKYIEDFRTILSDAILNAYDLLYKEADQRYDWLLIRADGLPKELDESIRNHHTFKEDNEHLLGPNIKLYLFRFM